MIKFDELPESEQAKYLDFAAVVLNDLWYCQRVQEAWYIGTMKQHDYIQADEDEELVHQTAVMIFDFVESETTHEQ